MFRLTNMIPERIVFVSRSITIFSRVLVVIFQTTFFLIFTALQPSYLTFSLFPYPTILLRLYQWSLGLRRKSAVARLLRFWVRIPPGAWISVCCECCVLSGRGLCEELITRPGELFLLWWVVMYGFETLWMRKPWPTGGCCPKMKKKCIVLHLRVHWLSHVMFCCRSCNDTACLWARLRMI